MRALRTLGVPYSEGEIAVAATTMAAQAATIAAEVEAQQGPTGLGDKEIVALTAYLQRLGTDIRWTRPAAQPPFAASVAPAPSAPASSGGASR
jgi:cytochrome c oxidase cbb3-type subunit I/II